MPRFHCPSALVAGALLDLPAGVARHVQVLRLQPGDLITLFDGTSSGEFSATVIHMGRSSVQVQVSNFVPVEREPRLRVHLALGMPANERMDWLVEKATELGVTSIQPLMTERTVLRLSAERAEKKVAHWHSVAVAACEQCGGNRVPQVHPVMTLADWLKMPAVPLPRTRLLLTLRQESQSLRDAVVRPAQLARLTLGSALLGSDSTNASTHTTANALPAPGGKELPDVTFLSGPEGGLSLTEESAALTAGYAPVTLGPRVLRAETAALAALSMLLLD
ncbi:MAG: 16S rRNA (uracil(1498)-N(3))-methyltransferase [Comamonadaceae bacterium]|nr:16S rRNA (uracil(1498)-N(3))-methyltransferase [Comamonadaceae bacterium]